VLQVQEGPACALRALGVVEKLCLPSGRPGDPLWQQPFNPAALVAPSVLDSCLTLLDKLATSTRHGAGSRSVAKFGKGTVTVRSDALVRPLPHGRMHGCSH
jgi:hypothetical protein